MASNSLLKKSYYDRTLSINNLVLKSADVLENYPDGEYTFPLNTFFAPKGTCVVQFDNNFKTMVNQPIIYERLPFFKPSIVELIKEPEDIIIDGEQATKFTYERKGPGYFYELDSRIWLDSQSSDVSTYDFEKYNKDILNVPNFKETLRSIGIMDENSTKSMMKAIPYNDKLVKEVTLQYNPLRWRWKAEYHGIVNDIDGETFEQIGQGAFRYDNKVLYQGWNATPSNSYATPVNLFY